MTLTVTKHNNHSGKMSWAESINGETTLFQADRTHIRYSNEGYWTVSGAAGTVSAPDYKAVIFTIPCDDPDVVIDRDFDGNSSGFTCLYKQADQTSADSPRIHSSALLPLK